ncbi:hypothetical protein PICMEDRAFT_16568 [Pichia membranifaciens NRRL Y-2026]|uniref:Uncharacterized protein n=1 Tax=Pichia membranifaciens NRRL Y-2026 TaxID=763406 RepID=A0A1E3NKS3_9ASCO|nr:hypothetical protein PICMEDRAFT_16568 [Pichia membranifaciens NRRL Y-2026]ODQ46737.1 hypothetical protein PICMEDRAFT_16568 [Pichia membranifaciens NRRL Y-2026]
MFASTVSNKPVAVAQPISPQKQMIEFKQVPIKQVYHLSIFMLPNVQFDPDYTALVYYQILPEIDSTGNQSLSNTQQVVQNDFKLLGFLNDLKQSAIFKLNPGNIDTPVLAGANDEGDIDMESGISELEELETVTMIIGISIEPNQTATQQLDCLRVTRDYNTSTPAPAVKSTSTVATPSQSEIYAVSNKIIGNAYNYLSSFTDEQNKVSISKFNNWWDKFRVKMRNDPNYLQTLE